MDAVGARKGIVAIRDAEGSKWGTEDVRKDVDWGRVAGVVEGKRRGRGNV